MNGQQLYETRLRQLVEILREFKPEKIYAFGSWAWGKGNKDSDIDLLMVVPPDIDRLDIKRRFSTRLFDSDYPYDLDPDLHVVAKDRFEYRLAKNDFFISNVVKGKLVYESE